MSIDKHALRSWIAHIRNILNHEWDPIGGCPPDEYDRYVDKIASMIRAGASDDELMRYLEWTASIYMGIDGFDPEHARKVVVFI